MSYRHHLVVNATTAGLVLFILAEHGAHEAQSSSYGGIERIRQIWEARQAAARSLIIVWTSDQFVAGVIDEPPGTDSRVPVPFPRITLAILISALQVSMPSRRC